MFTDDVRCFPLADFMLQVGGEAELFEPKHVTCDMEVRGGSAFRRASCCYDTVRLIMNSVRPLVCVSLQV